MIIPFTQFLRPDGRPRPTSIDRPEPIAHKALDLIAKGYEFHIEELTTGEVSMTIYDPKLKEDVACELCPNAPLLPAVAVDKMISEFEVK